MEMQKIIPFFMSCLYAMTSAAQSIEPCGHSQVLEQLEKKYSGYKESYEKHYKDLIRRQQRIVNRSNKDTIYTLPVVFHVIYNNNQENVADSLIYQQLDILNKDFRRQNADTTLTRNVFKSRAGDTRIQFVFADKDPNGNPTNGITRKFSNRASWINNIQLSDDMKYSANGGVDAWDPSKYINIWVCDISSNGFDFLLGFAYPPFGHPNWGQNAWVGDNQQGIVLHYKIVGPNNPALPQNLLHSNGGRVLTHEMGHYLGLRHIWGDDQNLTNRCVLDDLIEDTPLSGMGANFNCNLNSNTCADPNNEPDMIENYMDYASHSCQNMFTNGQILVMRAAITTYRNQLPSKIEIIKEAEIPSEIIAYFDQSKIFSIKIPQEFINQNVNISVFDLNGKTIYKGKLNTEKSIAQITEIKLAPAAYIIRFENSSSLKMKIQKFISPFN